MKKTLTAIFLAALLSVSLNSVTNAQQQAGSGTGIGFMVGEPTGLSLKSWTGGNNAFDVGLAWSLGRYDAINIHADYLWHNFNLFDVNTGTMPLYYGIGGRLILAENDAIIGARVPVGINYLFENDPIGLFLEVAPIFNLAPATDFDVDGALGVRFYL